MFPTLFSMAFSAKRVSFIEVKCIFTAIISHVISQQTAKRAILSISSEKSLKRDQL